jgi:hypothetical protein
VGEDEVIRCRWCGLELAGDPYGVTWVSRSGHLTTSWCQASPDKVNRRHEPGGTAPDPEEARLRAHNRELANRMAVRGMWHEGSCASCGTECQVIGLPGSEYCMYCEELRVLAGAAGGAVQEPAPPQLPSPSSVSSGRLSVSVLLGLAGFLLAVTGGPELVCAALLMASVLLALPA